MPQTNSKALFASMARKARRWSEAKLDKELTFAIACRDDNDEATVLWWQACVDEAGRRASKTWRVENSYAV